MCSPMHRGRLWNAFSLWVFGVGFMLSIALLAQCLRRVRRANAPSVRAS